MKGRHCLVAMVFISISCIASAADHSNARWRISVLATDITDARDPAAGVGMAASFAASPAWDVELGVGVRSYRTLATTFTSGGTSPGTPPLMSASIVTYPARAADLTVARRFRAHRTLSPYLRAGLRYVDIADIPGSNRRASLQAGVGARLRLTNNTALRAEIVRLVRSHDVPFDRLTRGSIGMSWNF
jgi:hypothetical protein